MIKQSREEISKHGWTDEYPAKDLTHDNGQLDFTAELSQQTRDDEYNRDTGQKGKQIEVGKFHLVILNGLNCHRQGTESDKTDYPEIKIRVSGMNQKKSGY
jgi:hypothetical protein